MYCNSLRITALAIHDITERKQIIKTMSEALDILEHTNQQLKNEISQRVQIEEVLAQH
jgi:hypothetical protein